MFNFIFYLYTCAIVFLLIKAILIISKKKADNLLIALISLVYWLIPALVIYLIITMDEDEDENIGKGKKERQE